MRTIKSLRTRRVVRAGKNMSGWSGLPSLYRWRRVVLCALALAAVLIPFGFSGPSIAFARPKTAKTYTIPTPRQPDYSEISWLLGEWTGKTAGKKAQGQVLLSVAYELGQRFIIFREQLALPPADNVPATHEGFMGILYSTAGGFEMNLYSSNGFVSHYRVTVKHGEIDFNPAGGPVPPEGWLFRRIIKHTDPAECSETVEVAPPQGTFFKYYTANLARVTPPVSASAPKPAAKREPPGTILPGPGE